MNMVSLNLMLVLFFFFLLFLPAYKTYSLSFGASGIAWHTKWDRNTLAKFVVKIHFVERFYSRVSFAYLKDKSLSKLKTAG